MTNPGLLWRTVRHLTLRQIVYQVLTRLRRRARLRFPEVEPQGYFLTIPDADKVASWQNGIFTFLNQRQSFPHRIDWNFSGNGKLWTYHLNYFDFLNQPGMTAEAGLALIQDFISQTNTVRDGLEPYPTSLRIINWVAFLSRNQVHDPAINRHLFAQIHLLSHRLEYHLSGNHLLENGFSWLIGALYFRHEKWFRLAANLVRTELTAQLLADGCHYERSPMYHQILLDRLLTVLLALQHDRWHKEDTLLAFLNQKASQMLNWLEAVTFRHGDVPMVNDSTAGVAPTTRQLREKAGRLVPSPAEFTASRIATVSTLEAESGYRFFRQDRYELMVNVGSIGPDHQPGHAHADTFSFLLNVDNSPIIVDNSASTYQLGQRRTWERSTAAHNTVEVNRINSSEVWAGFRVGRRARVKVQQDTESRLMASHDGYQRDNVIHQRTWSVEETKICITDRLLERTDSKTNRAGVARLYFHPAIQIDRVDNVVMAGPIKISFSSVTNFNFLVTRYDMADGFNRLLTGKCVEVVFDDQLETTIYLLDENPLPNVLLRT
ncbi:heparinase II/III domain-containing protein [Spirosoma jeollabukense]